MVSCSDDCTLRVWACQRPGTAATGGGAGAGSSTGCAPPWRLLCTLSGYHNRTVYSCDWGPAGLLAAGTCGQEVPSGRGALGNIKAHPGMLIAMSLLALYPCLVPSPCFTLVQVVLLTTARVACSM